MLLADFVLIFVSCYVSVEFLSGADQPPGSGLHWVLVLSTIFFACAAIFGMGRFNLQSVGTGEVYSALRVSGIGVLVSILVRNFFPSVLGLSHGIVVAGLLVAFFLLCLRVIVARVRKRLRRTRENGERTIVVGTGNAALSLIHVIEENERLPFTIVGCVDDEATVRFVDGVRVLGRVADLPALIKQHDVSTVIIAIPSAPLAFVNRIVTGCAHVTNSLGRAPMVKVLPGASDLLTGNVVISRMRDIRLEDLLPRDPVNADLAMVAPELENRVVLVTGAGGSIGSELCRQIITFGPKLLLLLGHGENSLFSIEQELRHKFGFTRARIVLADIADQCRIRSVFSVYRPDIVFHAAAHKHVPILESNLCEAVRNNVVGTYVVAHAAASSKVAKFVLLSSDKVVNPTSVMGATKRVSELICQSVADRTSGAFVTVRFGNVLGSRGSVLPIFRRQLEAGGPITITHRNMERYFMTIPEAVSLVLRAMAMGRNGQVFVMDMGKPVKILHLAETIIMLSGLTPYRDVDIIETGARPGEKLYEEILTAREDMSSTSHERLFIAEPERIDYEKLVECIGAFEQAVQSDDRASILKLLTTLVPTYKAGPHLLNGSAAEPQRASDNGPATDEALLNKGDSQSFEITTSGAGNGAVYEQATPQTAAGS
jgi:FlaA1/EpsC-like NDP-sugar epimerase